MKKTKCASCGRYFTSTGEFDRHRVGDYGRDSKNPRRCLTDDEMTQRGWASALHRISNETGRPTRKVYHRYPRGSNASEIAACTV